MDAGDGVIIEDLVLLMGEVVDLDEHRELVVQLVVGPQAEIEHVLQLLGLRTGEATIATSEIEE